MPLNVTHPYVSTIVEGPNSGIPGGEVGPAEWNAAHNVTGNLPVTQLNSGTNANSTTFWRGDGVWAPSGGGVTYYINAAGSDSNNGLTPLTAWQTIAKVNTITAAPGTVFLFHGGDTFSGTIVVSGSGAPAAPVVYSSYGDGNAIINGGSASAITATDFDNLVFQNLTLTGSANIFGNSTSASGVAIITTVGSGAGLAARSNFLFNNLTISGFNWGIRVAGGVSGGSYVSNITIINCTVHDCVQIGIQCITAYGNQASNFNGLSRILVDRCTVYNIGQGNAITIQGVDGACVQNCLIHDIGFNTVVSGGADGPGIYFASASNVLVQNNEIYAVVGFISLGHDYIAIYFDFGSSNVIVQYNYIHDCASAGFATTTLTLGGVANNNANITFRYNLIICTGDSQNQDLAFTAIALGTLNAGETITGLLIHNNTIIANSGLTNNGSAFITDSVGSVGTMSGIVANNLLIAGATADFLFIRSALKFVGNIYFGGQPTPINQSQSISAWLSNNVSNNTDQEAVDGGQFNTTSVMTADPLVLGGANINASANFAALRIFPAPWTAGATNGSGPYTTQLLTDVGSASKAQLAPMSAASALGVNLNSVTPMQIYMPYTSNLLGVLSPNADMDFKGGRYFGDVIGSITCTRTATTATDLVFTSPMNASFTTFAANTLRITPGKGLLIEDARTQYFANPTSPTTQTTGSIPNNTNLVLWVNGPGTATVSNGSGTTNIIVAQPAYHGHPISFSMTSTGTIVITITGTLYAVQLEGGAFNSQPTSLITATGTRDADVVTTATSTPIGNGIAAALSGGNANGNKGGVIVFTNQPALLPVQNYYVLEDTGGTSYLRLDVSGQFGGTGKAVATANIGGNSLQSTNSLQVGPFGRNAIGLFTYPTQQNICVNGGVVTTTSASAQPNLTSPIKLGNGGNNLSLNGWIERIICSTSGNMPATAVNLPAFTSTVPISQNVKLSPAVPTATPAISGPITRDFYGNPVPYNGKWGVGAHQSTTVGNSFVANGATPVTVSDKNITDRSIVFFTLMTVGGTVGAVPAIKTITPATGFTVAATAGDTSTYNYIILG